MRQNMDFAEELNQKIIVQMIHTLGENSIGVTDASFIRDLGLIIELTKGSIYRSMGIPHPTHSFFEVLVDLDIDENDNSISSQIDLNMLEEIVEKYFEDDNDPEVS